MKRDLLQNNRFGSWRRIIFADLICFAIILIAIFGFCYAYFSNKVQIDGNTNMGSLDIMYCQNSTDTTGSSTIYGSINGDSTVDLNTASSIITPGDTLKIQGYAVNTSNVDVFVLGRLEVNFTNQNSVSEKDVIWYNISSGTPLYVEKGLFQVGASVLYASGIFGDKQQINASYTFTGDKFVSGYSITSVKFELYGHQAMYLDFAKEFDMDSSYNSYITASGGKNVYNDSSKKLVCHLITGRRRDVWKAGDANADGVLSDLETDSTGAYLINSCADWIIFKKLATTQSNTQNKTFKLNCYLDFNNDTTAKYISNFYGNFDGQGYTISNVNTTNEYCLFSEGYNASISNLGVDGVKCVISASSTTLYFGGIVRNLYQGKVENCFVVGASAYDSSIDYDVNITVSSSADCGVGGIVGSLRGDNASSSATAIVSNCYAKINIKCNAGSVGGITGYSYTNLTKTEFCYFEGKISGNYAGAIVGRNNTQGTIENCVAKVKSFTAASTRNNVINGFTTGASGDDTNTINCAYIKDGTVTKVGENQTAETVKQTDFYSIGKLRDLFGWDTSVWNNDVYHTASGMPVIKVFYNF